jgi:porphobilinogen synthase
MTQNFYGQSFPNTRLRRLRVSGWMRDMAQEHRLHVSYLIWPVFVCEGENICEDIAAMPGVSRWSLDLVIDEVKRASDLGIPAIALFPVVPQNKKTEDGSESANPDNLMCRAIAAIKAAAPNIGIITDVALDPYTTHGHDGILEGDSILNDASVEILSAQSLNQARAGADIIAPSDMMDGRIVAIRRTLETNNFKDTAIMSYAAKYASVFYGPFRDAVNSGGFLKGDKKTYQMNPANRDEAMREVAMDISEGADMVMVKPGLPYLDIVSRVKSEFSMPTFAYHVSGEYAMLKFAAEAGALNYEDAALETLLSFKRAKADGILTYCARDIAALL